MENFDLTSIRNREDLAVAQQTATNDIIDAIIGTEVSHKAFGIGTIINGQVSGNSAIIEIDFNGNIKRLMLSSLFGPNGFAAFVDEDNEAVISDYYDLMNAMQHQCYTAEEEERQAAKDAAKREKKRAQAQARMASMKEKAIEEVDAILAGDEKVEITEANEFYYTLGWLAAHCGTVTARMPDYLEDAFVRHFGDVERTVVDSTKVGPSGYTSQWRLSLDMSLVKADRIPSTLEAFLNPARKKVSKTSFVWQLVDDFGFKFGRKQDVEAIRDTIPYPYLDDFDTGLMG